MTLMIDIMVPIELNYAITERVARELAGKRKAIICEKPSRHLQEALSARELAQRYSTDHDRRKLQVVRK